MDSILILGRRVKLMSRDKKQLKGLAVGDILSYRFMEGKYLGQEYLFAKPIGMKSTPRAMAITSNKVKEILGLPLVYILESCPAYLRQRLIEKGVFFVVSDKFAFLPTLIANERIRITPEAERLTPVAQYLLLYHLQVKNLDGMAAKEISSYIPYSYSNVTLGLVCLEDLGLIRRETDDSKRKVVQFTSVGKALYDKALEYLQNPVESQLYCDALDSKERYSTTFFHFLALISTPKHITDLLFSSIIKTCIHFHTISIFCPTFCPTILQVVDS